MKILLVLVTVICSSTADIMGGHDIGKTFNNNVIKNGLNDNSY